MRTVLGMHIGKVLGRPESGICGQGHIRSEVSRMRVYYIHLSWKEISSLILSQIQGKKSHCESRIEDVCPRTWV